MKRIQGERTAVTVIVQKDQSSLVQYIDDGVLIRKYVPSTQVDGNMVADQVLAAGIQYGYPWDEIVITFDGRKFANEMHNVDLWTVEDCLKNPQKLWSALRATLADNLSEILNTAKNDKKGVRQNG